MIYYYGRAGVGKTTYISQVLNTLREHVLGFDYYSKMGGSSNFWDGYDNQLVCWLDDPVAAAVHRTGDEESVQRFKNVISTGETLVEVKHGSTVLILHLSS